MNSNHNNELNDIIKVIIEVLNSKNMQPLNLKKCTATKNDIWADVSLCLYRSFDKNVGLN